MPPLEEPEMEEGKTGEGTVLSAVPREGDGKAGSHHNVQNGPRSGHQPLEYSCFTVCSWERCLTSLSNKEIIPHTLGSLTGLRKWGGFVCLGSSEDGTQAFTCGKQELYH